MIKKYTKQEILDLIPVMENYTEDYIDKNYLLGYNHALERVKKCFENNLQNLVLD